MSVLTVLLFLRKFLGTESSRRKEEKEWLSCLQLELDWAQYLGASSFSGLSYLYSLMDPQSISKPIMDFTHEGEYNGHRLVF